MKTKARKQKDLEALTEQFKNAKAAMLVGFKGMTVQGSGAAQSAARGWRYLRSR